METVLKIKNLTKYYKKVKGVENLSLELHAGEILGFIGPNGAGKSTTIRSIMNLINKTSGEVYFQDKLFFKNDTRILRNIGYLPSEIALYDDYSVKDMLDYHQTFYKEDLSLRRIELVSRLQLDESKKIEDLSLGNLKKLGIILALMHSPKLLILDEPTSGLDPIMQNVFYDLLLEEKKKGTALLYSTHILSEVSRICDRVAIIKEGQLIKIENTEELLQKNKGQVTIVSPDIDISQFTNDFIQEGHTYTFKNNLSYNDLISKLTSYHIEKLVIEDMNLEDLFLHYYK